MYMVFSILQLQVDTRNRVKVDVRGELPFMTSLNGDDKLTNMKKEHGDAERGIGMKSLLRCVV